MSRVNLSLSRAVTRASELPEERHIDLADNTQTGEQVEIPDLDVDELLPITLRKTGSRLNPTKLREGLVRRKYAKYSEDHYSQDAQRDGLSDPANIVSNLADVVNTREGSDDTDAASLIQGQSAGKSRLRRGQHKIRGLLNTRQRTMHVPDMNTEIDILFENQRGSWLFGAPLFSSKSLLNFDPAAWTNALGNPSSMNITNAQLPDPSWNWVWRTWYVDMSLDVDEQGWQYNFMFNNHFAWHGTHPWFHSFVRRRRWIRKRARTGTQATLVPVDDTQCQSVAHTHKLNADYFSIHVARGKIGMEELSDTHETNAPHETEYSSHTAPHYSNHQRFPSASDSREDVVNDISTLWGKLKKAALDREKIQHVLHYMEHGRDDTHHLAEAMPQIMSMFIFQHSRRQLISSMQRATDEYGTEDSGDVDTSRTAYASSKQAQETRTDAKTSQRQSAPRATCEESVKRVHDDLVRAVKVAEAELGHLEYWSDVPK